MHIYMNKKETDDEIVKYMIDMMTDRGRITKGNCSKLDLSNYLNSAEKWQILQIMATKTTMKDL